MGSFAKYIGGSPTDTAGGTARLGLRSAVITRGAVSGSPSSAKLVQSVQHSSRQLPKVTDEHFIREEIAGEGAARALIGIEADIDGAAVSRLDRLGLAR